MNDVIQKSKLLDGVSIRAHLRAIRLPEGVSLKSLTLANRQMGENALRLMSMNGCGGLPGPVVEPPTLARRLFDFLDHWLGNGVGLDR